VASTIAQRTSLAGTASPAPKLFCQPGVYVREVFFSDEQKLARLQTRSIYAEQVDRVSSGAWITYDGALAPVGRGVRDDRREIGKVALI
jgi:hypothetical protein